MPKYKGNAMTVMRCMSRQELMAYCRGETLRNMSVHHGSRTTSIGFCFFPMGIKSDPIEVRLHYLSGIVSMDYVCIFETINGMRLTRAEGWYREVNGGLFENMIKRTEFCTTVYDRFSMKLISAGKPKWQDGDWVIDWIVENGKLKDGEEIC